MIFVIMLIICMFLYIIVGKINFFVMFFGWNYKVRIDQILMICFGNGKMEIFFYVYIKLSYLRGREKIIYFLSMMIQNGFVINFLKIELKL